MSIHVQPVGALEVEHDAVGIGARTHHEVVLDLALRAVVHEVDAGVEVLILHPGVGGNIGPPLRWIAADEVVGLARKFLRADDVRRRVGADVDHAERELSVLVVDCGVTGRHRAFHQARGPRGVRRATRRDKDRFAGGQEEAARVSAPEEFDPLIHLPAVRLELQRQVAVDLAYLHPDAVVPRRRGDRGTIFLCRRRDALHIRD